MRIMVALLIFAGLFLGAELRAQESKISLDVKGMDIVEVLNMLAERSEMNLAIDRNVAGRVTVFLKDVSPSEALDAVLASNHLALKKDGPVSRVMTAQDYEQLFGVKFDDRKEWRRVPLRHVCPQDLVAVLSQVKSAIGSVVADDATRSIVLIDTKEKNEAMAGMIASMDVPLSQEVFKLNYAKAETVAASLQDVVTKHIATIKVDPRVNQILVIDDRSKLDKIREMIKYFDERTPEVLIDARIVQVNLSDKASFGIDWEYVLNKKLDVRGMFGQVISTTGNKWTIGSAEPKESNDYRAVIEALKSYGSTKILSSPRLTVTNHEDAKILVGSKQVYVTTSAVQGQTSTQTAEAVNFVDVGVKLFVTPAISPDGFIMMRVKPEVSSVVQSYQTASGNVIPIVETSETETTVLVKDGSTVIIGGLMKEEKIREVHQVPLLGSIPFLGNLFKSTAEETRKTELAIFLTCRILEFC